MLFNEFFKHIKINFKNKPQIYPLIAVYLKSEVALGTLFDSSLCSEFSCFEHPEHLGSNFLLALLCHTFVIAVYVQLLPVGRPSVSRDQGWCVSNSGCPGFCSVAGALYTFTKRQVSVLTSFAFALSDMVLSFFTRGKRILPTAAPASSLGTEPLLLASSASEVWCVTPSQSPRGPEGSSRFWSWMGPWGGDGLGQGPGQSTTFHCRRTSIFANLLDVKRNLIFFLCFSYNDANTSNTCSLPF